MSLEFRSDARAIQLASSVMRVYCEYLGLGKTQVLRLELALVEALNNIIAHGCEERSDVRIGVVMEALDDVLLVEIRDEGSTIDELPGGEMPDPLQESGRGWPLIRACVDGIDYRSENGENILSLTKSLRSRGDAD